MLFMVFLPRMRWVLFQLSDFMALSNNRLVFLSSALSSLVSVTARTLQAYARIRKLLLQVTVNLRCYLLGNAAYLPC